MKAQKKLNIVLVVLIILLISLVSFGGIFYQNKSEMVNKLPSYILGTNISGYRKVTLEVEKEEETKTESTESSENEVEEQVEVGNAGDYRKSAEIIKARLKTLKVEDYTISLDESTGKIEINIPENDQTDIIISDLVQKGSFQIIDDVTGEVLLSNKDVNSVDVGTVPSVDYTTVYMAVNFNHKGSKKFKEITASYQNQVIENDEAQENEIQENQTDNQTSLDANEVASDETSEETEKTKKVTMQIDASTIMTTYFSEIVDNGVLQLTLGSSQDNDEIKNTIYSADNLAAIIENEVMPLQYEIKGNIYVESSITANRLKNIIYVMIGVMAVDLLYMIIRYRLKGLLSAILSVGYLATLLIVIRFTNVVVSVEGIFAITISFIMNSIFNCILLEKVKEKTESKEEAINKFDKTIKKYGMSIVPIAILAVICCFVNVNSLYSFGMVMFWGIIVSFIYNLTITNFVVRSK